MIVDYIYQVISILWQTILSVYEMSMIGIDENKKSIADLEHQIANAKPSEPKPANLKSVKCSRCHARGHQTSECQTENPAAVRRRIANNNKVRSQQRATLAGLVPPVASAAATTHFVDSLANPQYANILADAREFRR